MQQKLSKLLFLSLMTYSLTTLAAPAAPEIYQAGTLVNLMNGVYTGSTTYAQLAKRGDLGLGTNNGLGGEMVEIDGKFYLADVTGSAAEKPLTEKTPFAMVTKFVPQQQFEVKDVKNIEQLETAINSHLSSDNLFYVIKVVGKFASVKARSMIPPKQPYPPLAEVSKTNQRIFEFHDIDGSLVIVKSPNFISPVSVPDYHIHFISADRKKAGHVLDLAINDAKVSVEQTNTFVLILPSTKSYAQANFQSVSTNQISAVEKKHF